MIFKNTLAHLIRVFRGKTKRNSLDYDQEAMRAVTELGQIIQYLGSLNISPLLVLEGLFTYWLVCENALGKVDIKRFRSSTLSFPEVVVRVLDVIFREVARFPDEHTSFERAGLKEKVEVFKTYIPDDTLGEFPFYSQTSKQVDLVDHNLSAVALNLIKRSSHLEHIPNAFFGYWFRLESLKPYLPKMACQKVWFYLPEIIHAVRKEIPSFFIEVT